MTLLPSRGSVCAPPLNLDGLVIASTRRRRWKWGWDIKGGICLFTQTLTLRTLSHCVRRPTTLSPPHYEKAKPHREATCRCSGQQCQPSSHPRPGSRCQGHRHTVTLYPVQIPDPQSPRCKGCFVTEQDLWGLPETGLCPYALLQLLSEIHR